MLKFLVLYYAPESRGMRRVGNKAVMGKMRMKSRSHRLSYCEKLAVHSMLFPLPGLPFLISHFQSVSQVLEGPASILHPRNPPIFLVSTLKTLKVQEREITAMQTV